MDFDENYSLTKEETNKIYEWQKKHNRKYHKKGFGYQGAVPVSNFEVRFGSCSIGVWCDCVCTKCFKKYELIKDSLTEKKREKALSECSYTVRDL